MSEQEPPDGDRPKVLPLNVESGSYVVTGEGPILYNRGPSRDGIRVSDSRGWEATADIADGILETASASGVKSEGEDLTLETVQILVRQLNNDGATWGQPVLLEDRVGRGVDCEACDTQDPDRQPLRVQVTRPKMLDGFRKSITLDSKAEVPPSSVEEAARCLWEAIEAKRHVTQSNVVLATNAIRTLWLALPPIVKAFRQRYGEAAVREGWQEIWVVAADGSFTERLDRPADTERIPSGYRIAVGSRAGTGCG